MIKGLMLEEVTKSELINAITSTISDHVLVLMTPAEAAALVGVNQNTITAWIKAGKLTDYSTANSHFKLSAKQVLAIKRAKDERYA